MKICSECGSKCADEALFCSFCGTRLGDKVSEIKSAEEQQSDDGASYIKHQEDEVKSYIGQEDQPSYIGQNTDDGPSYIGGTAGIGFGGLAGGDAARGLDPYEGYSLGGGIMGSSSSSDGLPGYSSSLPTSGNFGGYYDQTGDTVATAANSVENVENTIAGYTENVAESVENMAAGYAESTENAAEYVEDAAQYVADEAAQYVADEATQYTENAAEYVEDTAAQYTENAAEYVEDAAQYVADEAAQYTENTAEYVEDTAAQYTENAVEYVEDAAQYTENAAEYVEDAEDAAAGFADDEIEYVEDVVEDAAESINEAVADSGSQNDESIAENVAAAQTFSAFTSYADTSLNAVAEIVETPAYNPQDVDPVYSETIEFSDFDKKSLTPAYDDSVAVYSEEITFDEPIDEIARRAEAAAELNKTPLYTEEIKFDDMPEGETSGKGLFSRAKSVEDDNQAEASQAAFEERKSFGELLGEPYKVLSEIGSGEGTAYKALHSGLNKTVVLKRVHSQIENLANVSELVNKLKAINNPSLPKVIDYVQVNGTIYSVMEYIEGESLYKMVKDGKTIKRSQMAKWADQLAEAIKYLHSLKPQIIHADIKPSNIIISTSGRAVLADFNIAANVDEHGVHVIGYSDGYAPPEQYEFRSANVYSNANHFDDKFNKTVKVSPDGISTFQQGSTYEASSRAFAVVDERSDVYNFGATFYYALTGKAPEPSTKEVTPIKKTGAKVDREFAAVITKCMEKEPGKRYQTAEELAKAVKSMKRKSKTILFILAVIVLALILVVEVFGMDSIMGLFKKKPAKKTHSTDTVQTTPVPDDNGNDNQNTDDKNTPGNDEKIDDDKNGSGKKDDTDVTNDGQNGDNQNTDGQGNNGNDGSEDGNGDTDISGNNSGDGGNTTDVPTEVPTEIPTDTPAATDTPAPTETPEGSPTPTPAPTATPVPTPTVAPTDTPEPTPTKGAKEKVTATPIPTYTGTFDPTNYKKDVITFEMEDGSRKSYSLSQTSVFDVKASEVKYVYFGGFPNTKALEASTLSNLESMKDFEKKDVATYVNYIYLKAEYNLGGTFQSYYFFKFHYIKWKVLKSTKNELTLISNDVLAVRTYDDSSEGTTWNNSDLNNWLTNDFKSMAFSSREKKMLNSAVSICSQKDAENAKLFPDAASRKAVTTKYAQFMANNGVASADKFVSPMWWVKPNDSGSYSEVPYVDASGNVLGVNKSSVTSLKGVRPVVVIKIK